MLFWFINSNHCRKSSIRLGFDGRSKTSNRTIETTVENNLRIHICILYSILVYW
jgi:hypothetical protein